MTGAQAVIRSILLEKIDTIFGYPGGAIMPVYDALYPYNDRINHILTRHEQGAIHAAQGYARASGKLSVVLATSGPGATNLVTGLADAQIDSTPLVCITGQVASNLLGTDAFQETDIISISNPVTKWNYQVTDASEIPSVLAKAIFIAQSGRPGPVLIDITKDAQMQEMEFSYCSFSEVSHYTPYPCIDKSQITAAAKLINKASKPMAIVGQGVILGKAEQELVDFIDKSGIPVASTLLGLSALSSNHPQFVGMVGMHGNYAPNVQTNECDLLVAIGMRFDDRVTGKLDEYAVNAKIIHLDIDESEIGKNVFATVGVLGNVKESLPFLTDLIQKRNHISWLNSFEMLRKEEYLQIIAKELNPSKGEIKMAEVIQLLNQLYRGKAILVSDVGQHQMIVSRYAEFENNRSHISSGGLGTMGFALPAAIGAKLGVPEREVVAIIGDGGFQMNLQELGTILQSEIGIKIIILNNQFLGMVRQWQELFFEKRYSFTEMISPEFTYLAEAYSIPSKKVCERSDLKDSLKTMMEHDGAYLLEIIVKKEENVFPMVPTGSSVSNIRLS